MEVPNPPVEENNRFNCKCVCRFHNGILERILYGKNFNEYELTAEEERKLELHSFVYNRNRNQTGFIRKFIVYQNYLFIGAILLGIALLISDCVEMTNLNSVYKELNLTDEGIGSIKSLYIFNIMRLSLTILYLLVLTWKYSFINSFLIQQMAIMRYGNIISSFYNAFRLGFEYKISESVSETGTEPILGNYDITTLSKYESGLRLLVSVLGDLVIVLLLSPSIISNVAVFIIKNFKFHLKTEKMNFLVIPCEFLNITVGLLSFGICSKLGILNVPMIIFLSIIIINSSIVPFINPEIMTFDYPRIVDGLKRFNRYSSYVIPIMGILLLSQYNLEIITLQIIYNYAITYIIFQNLFLRELLNNYKTNINNQNPEILLGGLGGNAVIPIGIPIGNPNGNENPNVPINPV